MKEIIVVFTAEGKTTTVKLTAEGEAYDNLFKGYTELLESLNEGALEGVTMEVIHS